MEAFGPDASRLGFPLDLMDAVTFADGIEHVVERMLERLGFQPITDEVAVLLRLGAFVRVLDRDRELRDLALPF